MIQAKGSTPQRTRCTRAQAPRAAQPHRTLTHFVPAAPRPRRAPGAGPLRARRLKRRSVTATTFSTIASPPQSQCGQAAHRARHAASRRSKRGQSRHGAARLAGAQRREAGPWPNSPARLTSRADIGPGPFAQPRCERLQPGHGRSWSRKRDGPDLSCPAGPRVSSRILQRRWGGALAEHLCACRAGVGLQLELATRTSSSALPRFKSRGLPLRCDESTPCGRQESTRTRSQGPRVRPTAVSANRRTAATPAPRCGARAKRNALRLCEAPAHAARAHGGARALTASPCTCDCALLSHERAVARARTHTLCDPAAAASATATHRSSASLRSPSHGPHASPPALVATLAAEGRGGGDHGEDVLACWPVAVGAQPCAGLCVRRPASRARAPPSRGHCAASP